MKTQRRQHRQFKRRNIKTRKKWTGGKKIEKRNSKINRKINRKSKIKENKTTDLSFKNVQCSPNPENKKDFSTFRDNVHLFTNTLFGNYILCYIKKERPLKEFSEQYRTHMFNIHQIYLNELREKKHFVTNTIVNNYVNQLHPSLLMYCLNFQMRKRNVDIIVSETNIDI